MELINFYFPYNHHRTFSFVLSNTPNFETIPKVKTLDKYATEMKPESWAATHNFGGRGHVQCLRRPHHGWGRRAKKILRNFNPIDWLKRASFQESS